MPAADEGFGTSLDLHERRYCRIYPAALLVRYFAQIWAGGGYLMLAVFLMVGASLVLIALRQSIVFFVAPSDFDVQRLGLDQQVGLCGFVVEGSIERRANLRIEFLITDNIKNVRVSYQGPLPDLFRERGAVKVEGKLGQAGAILADTIRPIQNDETCLVPKGTGVQQENWIEKSTTALPTIFLLLGLLLPVAFIASVTVVWAIFDFLGSRIGIFAALMALIGFLPVLLATASSLVRKEAAWPPFAIFISVFGLTIFTVLILIGVDYLVSSFRKIGGIILLFVAFISLVNAVTIIASFVAAIQDFGTPAVDLGVIVLTLLMVALAWYVSWVLCRAAFSMLFVSSQERKIFSDERGGLSPWSRLLGRLLGLPTVFEFIQRPRRRFTAIVMLSFISAMSLIIASSIVFTTPALLTRLEEACSSHTAASRDPSCPTQAMIEIGGLGTPVVMACLFFVIGWIAQRRLRWLARLSLETLRGADRRAPVLYLRAFRDDQVRLTPAKLGLYGQLLAVARRRDSLDQILLEEATVYGPVVGLGNPSDKHPPYGAARAYLDNKSWQEAVAELARNSVAIVICVDNTDSIWWEIKHLFDKGYIKKTLFLFHPRLAEREINLNVAIKMFEAIGLGTAAAELRLELEHSRMRLGGRKSAIFGAFVDSNAGLQLAYSSYFSGISAVLTLRWFLRSKLGINPIPLPLK